jgi:hypothetical protein
MKDMIVDCDFSRLVWFKLLLWISSTIQQNYGYSLRAEAPDKLHNPAYCLVDLEAKENMCFLQ